MSCLYESHESAGRQIDTLTDETSGLRIQVSRHGAEIISIARRGADGQWTGFLWRDGDTSVPAEGWQSHCTVMGYYIHRLKDKQTTYRGLPMCGGTHSFIRTKEFAPPAADTISGTLTYSIGPGQFSAEEYPLKVRLNLTYALVMAGENPEVMVTFEFENLEPELIAHVSFGLHPGFALHSLEGARVLLPEGVYLRHLAPGDFLSGETVHIDHPGGPMPFDKAQLPGSFILELVEVPDATFTVEDPAGRRRIDLDFQEAPYVTLWSDGHAFICVEPCWGLPDHHAQRPFEEKEGIEQIAPGEKLVRFCAIRPSVLE